MLEERLFRDLTQAELASGVVVFVAADRQRATVKLKDGRQTPCTVDETLRGVLADGDPVVVASLDGFARGVIVQRGELPGDTATAYLAEI